MLCESEPGIETSVNPADDSTKSEEWDPERKARIAGNLAHSLESTSPDYASLPEQLGNYQVLEKIGEGGMGTVHRARQTRLDRIVAIKLIRRSILGNPSHVRRFRLEAESAAQLDHPGIVPVYDVGESGPYVFFAMSYMPGGTLADFCGGKALTAKQTAEFGQTIAEAVAYAHDRGIIHRDLKPSNILLDEDLHAHVADFGLAKHVSGNAELTASGEIVGTPAYIPPEQAQGSKRDTRTTADVYSLGAILFYLATGRPPFVGDNPATLIYQVIHSDPPDVRKIEPSVPIDLATLIAKCMARNPSDRYTSALELQKDLLRFLNGEPILARPIGALGRIWKWCRRRPVLAGMSLLALAFLTIGSIVSISLGLIANHRANQLAELNTELSDLGQRAQAESVVARARSDAAVRLLENMLYTVQRSFVDDPAAQENRRKLLESVLAELDLIPVSLVSDRRVQNLRASALLGLADVLAQAGDEAGVSGAAGSRETFVEAIELFRQLYDENPSDPSAAFKFADAVTEWGDRLAYGNQWREAKQCFLEALPINRRLREENPDSLDANLKLAQLELLLGESFTELGERKQGYQFLLSSRDRFSRLIALHPKDSNVLDGRCRIFRELGDWHNRIQDYESAENFFTKQLEAATAMVQVMPLDSSARLALSTAHERLGDVYLARGDFRRASTEHERSLEIAQELQRAAPENKFLQWQVAFSYERAASTSLRSKKLDRALALSLECVRLRTEAQKSDPGNRRYQSKLVKSLKTLASIYRTSKRFADELAALQRALQLTNKNPVGLKSQFAILESLIEDCNARLNAHQVPAGDQPSDSNQ